MAQLVQDHGPRVDDPASVVLTEVEYDAFSQVGRTLHVPAGKRLFYRGDPGAVMYVVAQGMVDLDFGDDLVGKRLETREFFGELGLLIGGHARSADATMASDGVLLELGRGQFDALAEREPYLLAHFLRRAIMRVVLNEQALIGRLRRRNLDLQNALDTLRDTAHRLDQTEALSRTDELTGMVNRRGFTAYLEHCRANGGMAGLSLMLVDCDRFKDINDTHGHLVGDRVLQGVASILRAVARPEDLACRLGGDEFCLLACGRSREELQSVANYILDSARALHRMHAQFMTTLSLGVCAVVAGANGDAHGDWERCYARADTALYRAKRHGGDRVEWQD